MKKNPFADSVKSQIHNLFGDTSDLSKELVNTLCNIYFFIQKAEKLNMGGLSDIKKILPNRSDTELVVLYLKHMPNVVASAAHAPKLIESMREARLTNSDVFILLEEVSIDSFKYGIDNAVNKSGIRRNLERKFKTVIEYENLAVYFNVPYRGGNA